MDGTSQTDGAPPTEGAPSPESGASGAGSAGAYRVLARKYRPETFEELIGQAPMVRTLSNAFETGRIAQAWMLTGVRGVGKTTTARILARALNYEIAGKIDQPTIHMPEFGEHCTAIMEGRHVDVVEMDAASHTGIADIREIIEQVRYRPVSARYKVYIIDEVHMLSAAAFNGLLKTLEEPPEHVKFVFATTEIRKVPVTVLSRCQRFDLRRIDADLLVEHMAKIAAAENVAVVPEALTLIARAAEGSARDSLSLLDQAIAHAGGSIRTEDVRDMLGLADRARVIDLFARLMAGDVAGALAELDSQYEVGADPAVVLIDLAEFVHLVTRLKFAADAVGGVAVTEEERRRGSEFAENLSVRVLSRAWQMLLKGIQEVQTAPKPLAAAEMVLVRLCYAADLPTPDEALKLLREGGTVPTRPATTSGGSASGPGAQAMAAPPRADYGSGGRGGGDGRARLSLASERAEPDAMADLTAPEPEPPAPAPQAAGIALASLADVAALARERRDLKLKDQVETLLHPVRFEPGRIEVELEPDAPTGLPGELGARLSDWTGMRWVVTVAREGGGATLRQRRDAERDRLLAEARDDPNVAAILTAFPGAEIVGVRVTRPEPEAVDPDAGSADGDTDDDAD
ncbi:DNA polymerase-3 subunit gamma/tau [Rhodobium orientis]|nr:DNA polymerase III subunit gamma/tau [Rhodobium orientis]MBB4301971.1 DNA polymerase-3 subunit gamma/tau [Rhodobium orientis]MBK5950208.1 DNA polymerase III subunit gamma/tau [Rhodobium orientis]